MTIGNLVAGRMLAAMGLLIASYIVLVAGWSTVLIAFISGGIGGIGVLFLPGPIWAIGLVPSIIAVRRNPLGRRRAASVAVKLHVLSLIIYLGFWIWMRIATAEHRQRMIEDERSSAIPAESHPEPHPRSTPWDSPPGGAGR